MPLLCAACYSPLAVAASLGQILIALLAAVALGVTTGIAMGLNNTVRGVLNPLIEIYRPVPPLAYLPLMVIWFAHANADYLPQRRVMHRATILGDKPVYRPQ